LSKHFPIFPTYYTLHKDNVLHITFTPPQSELTRNAVDNKAAKISLFIIFTLSFGHSILVITYTRIKTTVTAAITSTHTASEEFKSRHRPMCWSLAFTYLSTVQ